MSTRPISFSPARGAFWRGLAVQSRAAMDRLPQAGQDVVHRQRAADRHQVADLAHDLIPEFLRPYPVKARLEAVVSDPQRLVLRPDRSRLADQPGVLLPHAVAFRQGVVAEFVVCLEPRLKLQPDALEPVRLARPHRVGTERAKPTSSPWTASGRSLTTNLGL